VASVESFAKVTDTVAPENGCLPEVSINTPFTVPAGACAIAIKQDRIVQVKSSASFLIIFSSLLLDDTIHFNSRIIL
jgi:hypothetical protein